jgi:uncharacterized membrane protein
MISGHFWHTYGLAWFTCFILKKATIHLLIITLHTASSLSDLFAFLPVKQYLDHKLFVPSLAIILLTLLPQVLAQSDTKNCG